MDNQGLINFCDTANPSPQNNANGLALNPSAKKLYVSQGDGYNQVSSCSINPNGTLGACVDEAVFDFNVPAGLAYNGDAKKLYVANTGDNTVSTCTVKANGTLISCAQKNFAVITSPTGVAYNSVAKLLYVTNTVTGLVASCTINTDGSLGRCTKGVNLPIGTAGISLDLTSSY